jgi:diguanylate cyclase (GGDEF)-like protein/PAS domain S-box-containing protein
MRQHARSVLALSGCGALVVLAAALGPGARAELFALVLLVALGVMAFAPGRPAAATRNWRVMAGCVAAGTAHLLVNGARALSGLGTHDASALQTVGMLASSAFLAGAIALICRGPRRLNGSAVLDVLTVGLVVSLLVWVLLLAHLSESMPASDVAQAVLAVILVGTAWGFTTHLVLTGRGLPIQRLLWVGAETAISVGVILPLLQAHGRVSADTRSQAPLIFGLAVLAVVAAAEREGTVLFGATPTAASGAAGNEAGNELGRTGRVEREAEGLKAGARLAIQAASVSLLPFVAGLEALRQDWDTTEEALAAMLLLAPTALWRFRQLVSQRDQAVEAVAEGEAWYRSVVDHALEGIAVVTPDLRIGWVGGGEASVFGVSAQDKVGRPVATLLGPACSAYLKAHLAGALGSPGGVVEFESHAEHAEGGRRWLELRCVNRVDDPAVRGILVNFRDITRRKEAEQRLAYAARHDLVTRLANRAELLERLAEAEARCLTRSGRSALFFLDLDRFKVVNDSLGHQAGDQLLSIVAERLRRTVRGSDIVARFGGDEFAVLCEGLDGDAGVSIMGERIRVALGEPFDLEGQLVTVTASVGVRVLDGTTSQADEIIREADIAMYVAKEGGRDCAARWDEALQEKVRRRNIIDRSLRSALEHDELRLFYQPIVSLRTGQIEEVEALLRWQHPELGFLTPDHFIAAAEENGLIVPIGDWVLRTAVAQVAAWRRAGIESPAVAVNLSPRQLMIGDTVRSVNEALHSAGVGPSSLILEITESSLLDQTERAMHAVGELASTGVRIALDDFGTGYSSLAYLLRLPVGALKVDRMFVSRMGEDAHADALVAAVAGLGQSLGHPVVAEGVETPEQVRLLQELGIELGQGYLFGRPQPPEQLDRLLRSGPLLECVGLVAPVATVA